jgi:3-oxoacyl-[acyl-carrier protein] reductase
VQALGRRALALGADVTERPAVAAAVEATVRQLGGLHVLVNNAGIVERRRLEDLDEATLHRTLAVNVTGTILVTQAAWPHLRETGGAVVNIASVSGMVGGAPSRPADPATTASGRSGPAYAASKGAVIALTRWLAREGGALGIRVNAVAPGPVETEMTRGFDYDVGGQPLARMGQPEDIAQAVLYLASPMSAFVTGQVLVVDGGVVLD